MLASSPLLSVIETWIDPRIPTGFALVAAPTLTLMSVDEAKSHARIDPDVTDENDDVDRWLRAATRKVEQSTGYKVLTQTWDVTMDRFPNGPISLPFPPLQSVTSVKYYDSTNTLQTLDASSYIVDTSSVPARIGLADGQNWPTDLRLFQPIVIRLAVGWTDALKVPEELGQAARLVLGALSEQRDLTTMETALYDWFIAPYVLHGLG